MSTPRRARVTVAYATVRIMDPISGKPTVVGLGNGAVFPLEADPDNVANLVRREYAEWIDEAAPEPVPDESVDDSEPESGAETNGNGRPSVRASKEDWVAYAVTQRAEDVSEDDAREAAEAMTKADLVATFSKPADES